MLGHTRVGGGSHAVIVLNDWLCDTSQWDASRPYLDVTTFTWAFADLRGYGRSKGMAGAFTADEGARDVLGLADALEWRRFSLVGHSMSSLVALHVGQRWPDRLDRLVLVAPPPPAGFGADAAGVEARRKVALGDDRARARALREMWGNRLSEGWLREKVGRWRACADPGAVAGYVAMFARDGVPRPGAPVQVPVLAVTGEEDVNVLRADSVASFLRPICHELAIRAIADSGHYPMQETPPLLVAAIERFLCEGLR